MNITRAIVAENSAAILLARILGADGNPIAQADVSAIAVQIWDRDAATLVAGPLAQTISNVVFDTLQTDARWTADSTGFNLAIGISGTNLPSGDRTYRVEIKVTPVDGDPYYVLADLKTIDILSE